MTVAVSRKAMLKPGDAHSHNHNWQHSTIRLLPYVRSAFLPANQTIPYITLCLEFFAFVFVHQHNTT